MKEEDNQHYHRNHIHRVLTHGYGLNFILFLIGVSLDIFFHLGLFSGPLMTPIGLMFLILATIIILWAQTTSRHLHKKDITKESFCSGPYCYTRSPTHWGLFFLMLGFGVIINAFFVVLTTIIAFVVSKLIFLRKEEELLAKKYGTPYLEYKKLVRF